MEIQMKKKQILLSIFCVFGFAGIILWQILIKNLSGNLIFLSLLHIFLISLINETVIIYDFLKHRKKQVVKNSISVIFIIFNIAFLSIVFYIQ